MRGSLNTRQIALLQLLAAQEATAPPLRTAEIAELANNRGQTLGGDLSGLSVRDLVVRYGATARQAGWKISEAGRLVVSAHHQGGAL